jgi:RimJ/RimL family protein N-acetyltransferase
MPTDFDVRPLRPAEAEALVRLRMEALDTDPLAFAASLEDDRALSLDFVRECLANEAEQAVFGAFLGEVLVGMVGLYRDPKLKRRHVAHVWGVYVSTAARGRGAGRAMMEAAIDHARQWPGIEQLQLSASTHAPGPVRLYEAVGFRTWGIEREALKWNDDYGDEAHMVLEL